MHLFSSMFKFTQKALNDVYVCEGSCRELELILYHYSHYSRHARTARSTKKTKRTWTRPLVHTLQSGNHETVRSALRERVNEWTSVSRSWLRLEGLMRYFSNHLPNSKRVVPMLLLLCAFEEQHKWYLYYDDKNKANLSSGKRNDLLPVFHALRFCLVPPVVREKIACSRTGTRQETVPPTCGT